MSTTHTTPYAIAVHGGAGTIDRALMGEQREREYTEALAEILEAGEAVLRRGGSALDAVVEATARMEDIPLFNAGRGAVYNSEGGHELDASLMEGSGRRAGAVAGVSTVANPIRLARLVMERTTHVLLAGEGAEAFARAQGVEALPSTYFDTELRHGQWLEVRGTDTTRLDHSVGVDVSGGNIVIPNLTPSNKPDKYGTGGAVARDVHGHLAAATSTGGLTNKKFGRVGDTPLIGCGTWADDATCAVSCTGDGEFFIRAVAAHSVHARMIFGGMSLEEAVRAVLHDDLVKLGGEGGLISVGRTGAPYLDMNTPGMYRAWAVQDGERGVAIYKT